MTSKRAAVAVRKEIHHWNFLLQTIRPISPVYFMSFDQSALCELYLNKDAVGNRYCIAGCPITQRTGKQLCMGTPHQMAVDAMNEWGEGTGTRKKFRQACAKQLTFLNSLLKENQP